MDNYLKLKYEDNLAYLITSPHSLRYFTGFRGGEGIAVLSKEKNYLITDSRYLEAAQKEAQNFVVIECVPYLSKLKDIFSVLGTKTVVIEEDYLSVGQFNKIKGMFHDSINFECGSSYLERARIIKTAEEISYIKKAEDIGVKAFEHILGIIKDGITENDIAAEIDYYMRCMGAEKTSFDTIVISGKKTSMPHGTPSSKKIQKGDFITMDFGCVYNGYCSDMTRTIVLGKATDKQKEIYDIVLRAQLEGLNYLKAGIYACDADKVSRDIIKNAGYGEFFGHSLGHGVGLLIHELPNVSPKSDYILEENMVVSCEPGIYIPDFGGVRIEDLVVIKKDGIENLTDLDKKFIEIL